MTLGRFKVRNTNNLTTEQVKGIPFEYKVDDNNPILIGFMTYADEEYIYGEFEHNTPEDILLVFEPNKSTVITFDGIKN